MQPYVVRQGDYVQKLAYTFGFDPDAVWNDDKNADVRKLRPDPNILAPADVLYIPDQVDKPPDDKNVPVGSTSSFVCKPPTATVRLKFLDEELASRACSIAELPERTDLATDGDGVLTLELPVTLDTATLTFTGLDTTCSLRIGCLDPIETMPGVQQRLQNLGYLDDSIPDEAADPDSFGAALWRIGGEAGTPSGGTGPDPAAGDTETANPASSAAGGPAAPDSTQTAGDPPIDAINDPRTSKRLLDAHGC